MRSITIEELHDIQLSAAKDFEKICKENNIKYYLIAGCVIGSKRHGGFIPWDEDMDFAMMRDDYEKFLEICKTKIDTKKYFIQNYKTDKNCTVALSRFCIKDTFVDTESTNHLNALKFIYFDIFPLDNVPNDNKLKEKQKKDLLKINKFIQYKIGYRLKTRAKWKQFIHTTIAFVLKIIPFSIVIKKKENIMTKYKNNQTTHVCSMASKYSYDKQSMPREYYGIPTKIKFENTSFDAPEMVEEYLTQLYGNYMKLPPIEKRQLHHDGYFVSK